MGPLHSVSEYAVQWIKKMQNENLRSWSPRQDITDEFNEHVQVRTKSSFIPPLSNSSTANNKPQEWIKHTVWKDSCRSWYKNNETGRVNAVFPGSSLHYMKLIGVPRYEDFEIQRFGKNPWEFLGLGFTIENRLGHEKADCSPYLSVENIDPKWWEANGGNVEDLKKVAKEEREKRREVEGGEWIERRF
jgi:hypothetical protein